MAGGPPRRLDDEESRMEPRPQAASRKAKQRLGVMDDDTTVSLRAPHASRRGAQVVPAGSVGLRGERPERRDAGPASEEVRRHNEAVRQNVRERQGERRQRAWDKLDAARKAAEEKNPRISRFTPTRLDRDPTKR